MGPDRMRILRLAHPCAYDTTDSRLRKPRSASDGVPGADNSSQRYLAVRLGKAVRAASAGPGRLALEDGRGTAGRGPQRDAARRSAVAHHSVQDMAGRCY